MEIQINNPNPLTFNFASGGQGGAVNSVNGKTGDVVLNYEDVHALPDTTIIPTVDVNKQYVDQHDNAIINELNAAKEEFEEELDEKASTTYVDNQLSHKQDKLIAGTNISIVNNVISASGGGESSKDYTSLERLGNYLYKVTFDSVPEYIPMDSVTIGGCTSYVDDNGRLHRNFDWYYSETATFVVRTKEFIGMGSIDGLNDGNMNDVLVGQLPYHVVDGCNNYGIRVAAHVLYNDFEYSGSGDKDKPIQLLPNYILNNIHDINDIDSLSSYLDNLYIPTQLGEYLMHFLVTDFFGTTTYYIGPSDNGYVIKDASNNPKLTNFNWVNRERVDRTDSDIQLRPTGIERWNSIQHLPITPLSQVRFTLAYQNPNKLSEFIGLRDTDKYSTDAELEAIYYTAHDMYLERERDGSTWQTVYSVVYTNEGIETLNVQEDYLRTYYFNADYATIYDVFSHTSMVMEALFDTLLELEDKIEEKLDILTAGENISIVDNVISANFESIIPSPPSENGEYDLHCSVENGVVNYTWQKKFIYDGSTNTLTIQD